ncbi:unnamed protein product, partial [marine sediment metagenome]
TLREQGSFVNDVETGSFDRGGLISMTPFPPIPPSSPGATGSATKKITSVKNNKKMEYAPYCKFCGGNLAKGESICHVCGNKVI